MLQPATIQDLNNFTKKLYDLRDALERQMAEDGDPITDFEYLTRTEQFLRLYTLLANYQESKRACDNGDSEKEIYSILTSLFSVGFYTPAQVNVDDEYEEPSLEEESEIAENIRDCNEVLAEVVEQKAKILRIYYQNGQTPNIQFKPLDNCLEITGYSQINESEM